MKVSNCLQMNARQRILIHVSFKDEIEKDMKWVVTMSNAFFSTVCQGSYFQVNFDHLRGRKKIGSLGQ
jgi:hypothetical protein